MGGERSIVFNVRASYSLLTEALFMGGIMKEAVRTVGLAAVLCLVCMAAIAGEFYEKDGAAIRGYDPVAYFTERTPVKGSEQVTAEYKGSTFRFASAANREAFLAHPDRYAPQCGGFYAFGVAKGYKASTDPAAFAVVGDKLYLNYNGDVRARWQKDIAGYVDKADRNWPEVHKTIRAIE
jgi:YHS domain-containing protein